MVGVVGVMSQLVAHFTDVGYSNRAATVITGATALLGAAGKFFWAALCDRFQPQKVVTILCVMGAAGLSLIFFPASRLAVFGFIILFGFGMGGVMSTFPVIIAETYGRASFAAVARFTGVFLLIEISGYYLAARSFDLTGSYDTAYAIYIALDLAAILLIHTLKKPRLDNGWGGDGDRD
jgi:cyanate permease